MTTRNNEVAQDRRAFLKTMAAYSGGLMLAGCAANFEAALAWGADSADWRNRMGLELFTVRDLTPDWKSYQSTLAKVAAIGYKEVEASGAHAGLDPKAFRAMLDSLGLSMPSAHWAATEGPDLEKQLEGFQIIGIHYAAIDPANAPKFVEPVTAEERKRALAAYAAMPPQTEDAVKRTAAQYNRHGKIARKFGIKMLIHNHTVEFAPFADNPNLRPYDILLAETDPELTAMQLDIGWAALAGQDIIGMFRKNPGRYELWHVKDAKTSRLDPKEIEAERFKTAIEENLLVPVGEGDIDYRKIFANAKLAGLKHFYIEQDNAPQYERGGSLAASKTSYQNLRRMLS
ncbi:MAG: sugar phosphate isomerase/epimerase family protein [Steroidobacteraceae bacterium]